MNGPFITKAFALVITIALVVISGTAWYTKWKLYLPFPDVINIVATILPIVDLFAIRAGILTTLIDTNGANNFVKRRNGRGKRSSVLVYLINLVLLLLNVALLTTSSQSLTHESLSCPLQTTWQNYFTTKNGVAINTIQTAFACCGYNSYKHWPYPFPSKLAGVTVSTCSELAKGRTTSCGAAWENSASYVSGSIVGIEAVTIVIKLVVVAIGLGSPVVFEKLYPGYGSSESNGKYSRRGIEYGTIGESRFIEHANDGNNDEEEEEEDAGEGLERGRIANGDDEASRSGNRADSRTRLLLPQDHGRVQIQSTDGSGINHEEGVWSRAD